ncbi:hypothetical protein KAJ38_00240 [Candidatus Pacearchaeota archaeon]|nr:hypothetical protein [Candidatus Pacearchaeota archaeon]
MGIGQEKDFGKRGIATVIAVVLIITLTVGIVSLAGGYVIILVKNVMGEIEVGESCTSLLLDVNTRGGYSCYDAVNGEVRMMIDRGAGVLSHQGHKFGGINVKASGENDEGLQSKNYNILEGSNAYTRTAGKFYGEYVDLLEEHKSSVYVVNVDYPVDKVSVTPIILVGTQEKLCPSRNDVVLEVCHSTFDPITYLVYNEQEMDLLNTKRGWPVTGFVASKTETESSDGNFSLAVSGGSAAFDSNLGIEKASYLEFSYKKDSANAYLSVFYHISGGNDNQWIEITDVSNRGYKGYDIPHETDTDWHTVTIDLDNFEGVGTCSEYSERGLVDDFQFTVWDSTTIYFDNVRFY